MGKRQTFSGILCAALVFGLIPCVYTASAAEETFSLNGYIQNQTGVFISTDDTETEQVGSETYYTNHGDKWGKFSMFRNTLQLEGEWRPSDRIFLHGVFRAARSSRLEVDEYAQMPNPGEIDDPVGWVHERYYQEAGMRELYLDFQALSFLSIRAGRQQVSWGETGQYRLLDAINPIDPTWHFASLESFEEVRIPLWILKLLFEVRPLGGNLEVVWVPALDDPEDMVTVPLTLVGAWGLPIPDQQGNQPSSFNINSKVFQWPECDIENSRIGARWKGNMGDFTYSLVYYYTHILSPPIPEYILWLNDEGTTNPTNPAYIDVYLEFPRQHLAGFSMEYMFSSPIWTIARLEATVEPNRVYPVYTSEPIISDDTYDGPEYKKYHFKQMEKTVLNYAVVLMRPTFIRFLNSKESVLFITQFMHSYITDFDELEHILDVPGYDSTESKRHAMKAILALRSNYLHGKLVPSVAGAYLFSGNSFTDAFQTEYPSGFFSASTSIVLGNHWRVTPRVTFFFGKHPYKGVGLYRDRDEVNLKIRYQF